MAGAVDKTDCLLFLFQSTMAPNPTARFELIQRHACIANAQAEECRMQLQKVWNQNPLAGPVRPVVWHPFETP